AAREPGGRRQVELAAQWREERLAGNARPGLERLLQHRVSQHHEPHRLLDALSPVPEKLLPAQFAQQAVQLLIAADDDGAAFVEDRQQVAQATTLTALTRDFRRVH